MAVPATKAAVLEAITKLDTHRSSGVYVAGVEQRGRVLAFAQWVPALLDIVEGIVTLCADSPAKTTAQWTVGRLRLGQDTGVQVGSSANYERSLMTERVDGLELRYLLVLAASATGDATAVSTAQAAYTEAAAWATSGVVTGSGSERAQFSRSEELRSGILSVATSVANVLP